VERQERTRAALVRAALTVFARDGFTGARLEVIAREAGYSKGAVYSNFSSKAELFLAAMDANLDGLRATRAGGPAGDQHGFALATLEFIATAGRDPDLTLALASRYEVLLLESTATARARRAADDPLTDEQVGVLLSALDQGAALLSLSGVAAVDEELLELGLRRLADPRGALGPS
jgi:AcrR family transcriptional regulator